MTAVWLEVLDAEGVPADRYEDCYRAEMSRRAELKAQGKELQAMAADDLAARWREVRRMNQEIDKSRLLPEMAESACVRCFGKMPHARMCNHVYNETDANDPLQSPDESVRAAAQAEQAKVIQEGIKRLGIAKAVDRQLKCSNPECGYTCNTAQGYVENQVYTLGDCMGSLKVSA
jgi:hypothetical protein